MKIEEYVHHRAGCPITVYLRGRRCNCGLTKELKRLREQARYVKLLRKLLKQIKEEPLAAIQIRQVIVKKHK